MARVLGESGKYVSGQATAKLMKTWAITAIVIALASFFLGLLVSLYLPKFRLSNPITLPVVLVLTGGLAVVFRWSDKRMKQIDQERMAMRKAAVGEATVAAILKDFPDTYFVVNDLSTANGNLDHVVIGPTGVFVIETKSWRGIVSSDGKGELLLNGKPTDKPAVRPFVKRYMDTRDAVKTLLAQKREFVGYEPYFQGVFAFTAARVEADWGSTGKVTCMRDDQLHEQIVDKAKKRLSTKEIHAIAGAFKQLADDGVPVTDDSIKATPVDQSATNKI